ncbi:hypothetical protein [Burkholderia pyrrocinia]|uniref:hypothetical protein n=1 Tax=Burkholderia pyrrocinia TaxID=60550 RepID=UPI00158CF8F0|nr:hypothetical protein [Burkholderia pyrrocinia]
MANEKCASLLVTREPEQDPRAIRLTIEQIARDAGVSPDEVKACITKAERAGWLEIRCFDGAAATFIPTIPARYRDA